MNRTTLIISVFTVALAILSSCNRKTVYNHYEHTPTGGWNNEDTLLYKIKGIKETGTYTREVCLRYTHNYPFTNLCLIIEQQVLPSGNICSDTLHCQLTGDDENKPEPGLAFKHNMFRLPAAEFNENDSIVIKVYHDMRRKNLQGISDVGIKIEKE